MANCSRAGLVIVGASGQMRLSHVLNFRVARDSELNGPGLARGL